MRRHLPRWLLTGALLFPATLYALGLGEIRLNSALNQPFSADIELISPTAEELASLKVGLAPADLFTRYGIDRPAFLAGFEFSVGRGREGRPVIKVSSNRSVTEPFVTLLVEARWARGRLLREYTVLLDPPVFMPTEPQAAAPVTTPQAGAQTGRIERQPPAEPRRAAEPAQAPLPQPEPEVPGTQAPEPVASAGGEYTVQRNDTLWRIASGITPGSPSDINRTMIALFRANPEAFSGNINRLRSGSVLRIPELTEIESVSSSEATSEVARQAAEWSGAQPTQVASEDRSRLRLVTPEETAPAPGVTTPSPAEPVAEPAPVAAPPAGAGRDDSRLELPSAGLADAQRSVTEAPVEPGVTETPPATDEPTVETAPAEEPAPAAASPSRSVAEEPPAPSLMERLGEYWWVLVVLGLLLVVGLVAASIRRRRAESAESFDTLAPLSMEPRFERASPPLGAAPAAKRRTDSFLVEDSDQQDEYDEPTAVPPPPPVRRTEAPKTRPVEPAPAPKPVEDTLSSETAVRFDQQDALAEADFHMAYGLYDQAADLVKIAIDREPGRRDLKLKLLEIYFVWGNRDLFLETARELNASRDEAEPGEWDKVLIMGKQIAADDPMFQGEAGGRVGLVDVNLEGGENRIDVDLFAEPEGDKPVGMDLEFTSGEHQAPHAEGNGDLDFLLDEPKRGSDEEPTRELDPLARTQETPTIESPMLDRSGQTVREQAPARAGSKGGTEQTAELSIDDLGLDVDALEQTGSLEDTTSLEKDDATGERDSESAAGEDEEESQPLRDDEMTQLAPSISSFDRTLESPRPEPEKFDIESTGTIYIDQVDLSGGDTVEQPRPDVDSTASLKRPVHDDSKDIDFDLGEMADEPAAEKTQAVRRHDGGDEDFDRFSSDVFADRTSETPRIDLDVGEPLSGDGHEPTQTQPVATTEMELSELEPVTMSEVGTKLDLARAYMDMGDPDGARSILEEVLSEGTANQKQEAQRLIESIR